MFRRSSSIQWMDLASALRFAHLGLTSNLFGLACPFGFGAVLASFLLGLLFSISCSLVGAYFLLPHFRLNGLESAPSPCSREGTSSRLAKYLHEKRQ